MSMFNVAVQYINRRTWAVLAGGSVRPMRSYCTRHHPGFVCLPFLHLTTRTSQTDIHTYTYNDDPKKKEDSQQI